ncbi:hypothetical protein G7B11_29450, partial [Klebsiella pneumoniae]|nr:hypothetical protein [Klebsiella pneumoniae]
DQRGDCRWVNTIFDGEQPVLSVFLKNTTEPQAARRADQRGDCRWVNTIFDGEQPVLSVFLKNTTEPQAA